MFDLKYHTRSTVTMTNPCDGCAIQSIKYKDCIHMNVILKIHINIILLAIIKYIAADYCIKGRIQSVATDLQCAPLQCN